MKVWFEAGSSEYIEYIQMRSTNLSYEYYDIMYDPPFPNKCIRETLSYI